MTRKLRRFTEEPIEEVKVKPIKNDTRSEVHFYQTDCFSYKFSKKNRECGNCVFKQVCQEQQIENESTLKSCELDYRKVYVHDQIKRKDSIYELKLMKDLLKMFVPALLTDDKAVIVLPVLTYSEFTNELYEFLGLRGKNYITCLHPLIRSDFGLVSILSVVPCKLSEAVCCHININADF